MNYELQHEVEDKNIHFSLRENIFVRYLKLEQKYRRKP